MNPSECEVSSSCSKISSGTDVLPQTFGCNRTFSFELCNKNISQFLCIAAMKKNGEIDIKSEKKSYLNLLIYYELNFL